MPIRELYETYSFSDLARHRAVLIIPYQVSIMSLFEYYAMQIPIFAPSLELLIEWQVKHLVLDELSWNCVHKKCNQSSQLRPHKASAHLGFDPNDVSNSSVLRHWLQFADFYQWPEIILFDSWEDLISKIDSTDLSVVSEKMGLYRKQQIERVTNTWSDIFKVLKTAKEAPVYIPNDDNRAWERNMLRNHPGLSLKSLSEKC